MTNEEGISEGLFTQASAQAVSGLGGLAVGAAQVITCVIGLVAKGIGKVWEAHREDKAAAVLSGKMKIKDLYQGNQDLHPVPMSPDQGKAIGKELDSMGVAYSIQQAGPDGKMGIVIQGKDIDLVRDACERIGERIGEHIDTRPLDEALDRQNRRETEPDQQAPAQGSPEATPTAERHAGGPDAARATPARKADAPGPEGRRHTLMTPEGRMEYWGDKWSEPAGQTALYEHFHGGDGDGCSVCQSDPRNQAHHGEALTRQNSRETEPDQQAPVQDAPGAMGEAERAAAALEAFVQQASEEQAPDGPAHADDAGKEKGRGDVLDEIRGQAKEDRAQQASKTRERAIDSPSHAKPDRKASTR